MNMLVEAMTSDAATDEARRVGIAHVLDAYPHAQIDNVETSCVPATKVRYML